MNASAIEDWSTLLVIFENCFKLHSPSVVNCTYCVSRLKSEKKDLILTTMFVNRPIYEA